VFEESEPEPLPVHIVYPPRKPVPLKLRASQLDNAAFKGPTVTRA
jgi:hypothetical protein